MKAVIWTKYGAPDGLQLEEIPKPVPGENEVCIKVYATSVVAGDCEMRSLSLSFILNLMIRLMNGIKAPKGKKLLGQEFAGVVESTGSGVTQYKKGDQLFGATGFGHGTYAEYICLPADSREDVFIVKPENLPFEQAAAIPVGALEALNYLHQADIKQDDIVLINGAGGSIGTAAIQLAKLYGAEVSAVDRQDKLAMLKSIGADHVIDYMQEDFTTLGKKFDVIFDVVGKANYGRTIRSLKPAGRYLLSNPTFSKFLRSLGTRLLTNKKLVFSPTRRSKKDLLEIIELYKNGTFQPVIDRIFTLDQMVDAHRYVDSGLKQGNVVITIRPEEIIQVN